MFECVLGIFSLPPFTSGYQPTSLCTTGHITYVQYTYQFNSHMYWLVGWFVGWLVGWLVGWWVVGWWLVGWSVGWLVGWVVDWLVGFLKGQRVLTEHLFICLSAVVHDDSHFKQVLKTCRCGPFCRCAWRTKAKGKISSMWVSTWGKQWGTGSVKHWSVVMSDLVHG